MANALTSVVSLWPSISQSGFAKIVASHPLQIWKNQVSLQIPQKGQKWGLFLSVSYDALLEIQMHSSLKTTLVYFAVIEKLGPL